MAKTSKAQSILNTELRNTEMFMRYVEGASLQQIADEFGLKYTTVKKISCNEKWANRMLIDNDAKIAVCTKFINTADDLLSRFYKDAIESYNISIEMQRDARNYTYKDGRKDMYKWNKLQETIVMNRDELKKLTGIVDPATLVQCQATIERVGLNDKEIVTSEDRDNFLQALDNASSNVWGDEGENQE